MNAPALLVIDMQQALVEGAHDAHGVVARIASLIDRAREGERPVVYVQHDHATRESMMKGRPGWRIHPDLQPASGDLVIDKQACDAFFGTPLEQELRDRGIATLIVTGMQTEYCVDATCRAALSHDFDVVLVRDGHTTHDGTLPAGGIIAHHNAVLADLAHPTRSVTLCAAVDVRF